MISCPALSSGTAIFERLLKTCTAGLLFATSLVSAAGAAAAGDAALWHALKSGGHAVIMRHAIAPGVGDPDDFRIGECSTQRNLSPAGREQAQRIGARLRTAGLEAARVYTSQWCRAFETATLLGLGEVAALPELDSFFTQSGRAEAQTRALTQWLDAQDLSRAVVLVTHQVNVTALTGAYPASGELVVIRRTAPGRYAVAGRLRP